MKKVFAVFALVIMLSTNVLAGNKVRECQERYAKANNTNIETLLKAKQQLQGYTALELKIVFETELAGVLVAVGSIGCDYAE